MNGHSWTITEYQEENGKVYEVHVLFTIDGDRVVEKEIKRVELS